jgi:HEAT repeat protein
VKGLAHVEVVIALSCFAWSQAAAGEVSSEDVRAALEEIASQRKGKAIAFGRPLVSKEAQAGFAEFGDEAVAELRRCVEGKGLVDLNTALLLLGCLRGETGWNLLEGHARGADVRLRSHAVLALGSLDTERSVSLLNELALDPATAHEAITSLGSLVGVAIWYGGSIRGPMEEHVSVRTEPPPSKRALEVLKRLLAEERCPQRSLALAILTAAAPEDVRGLLPELSRDEENEIRLRTAGLLRKVNFPEAVALARALAKDEDAKVRFAATKALVELGDAAAVPALATFLGSDDKLESYKAFHLARELESIEGLRERLAELLSPDDSEIACRAAGILHYHRDKRGFEFLVRELHANRHEAARALEWSMTPDDLPTLIRMMDDPDFNVRGSVLGLLLAFDDPRVLDWVLSEFHSYDGFNRASVCSMKQSMVRYVSRFPNEETLSLLKTQLGRDERIRSTLCGALSRIPDRAVVPILRTLLEGPRRHNAYPELEGIARMGDERDVGLLLDCLDRSKPGRQLFQQATRALRAITGENLEGDAWRIWWEQHKDTFDPMAARIKSLSGYTYKDSLFFLTHFGNDKSHDAMRAELSKRSERSWEAIEFAKALALRDEPDGLAYLLSEGLDEDSSYRALGALHEATGRSARRSFHSMPNRWQEKEAQEYRKYFADGGEPDTEWRRKMFAASWQRSRAFLELRPRNPALHAVLTRFPSVPAGLRSRLQNPDGLIRNGALSEAGKARAPWSVPVLKAMLRDRDCGVRLGAALVLSRAEGEDLADVMMSLIDASDSAAREYASRWLGKNRVKAAIPRMIAAYSNSPKTAQSGIIWGLAKMEDDSLAGFFARAVEAEYFNTRRGAVDGLSRLAPDVALPHLKKACADTNDTVRREAVKAVFEKEGAESHAWFASLLQSPRVELRQAGLRGLLYHKDRPFPKDVVWEALHDENSSVRAEAMSALRNWQLTGEEGTPLLQAFLRETGNGPRMRLRAAETLACRDGPLAITEVALHLKGSDRQLRSDAYHAMRRLPRATRVRVLGQVFASGKVDIDALSTAVGLAGSTKDRELLRSIVQLLERGLDTLPTKRGYMGDHQRWNLLKAICSCLKEITGREFLDPEAVSSERSEIGKAILDWWKKQPESVER